MHYLCIITQKDMIAWFVRYELSNDSYPYVTWKATESTNSNITNCHEKSLRKITEVSLPNPPQARLTT